LLSLPGRVQEIQRACCADAVSCENGTPDRCDATCAQGYLPFYFDCQHVLETSMQQPTGSSDFGLLEARCSALLGTPRTLVVTGLLNSDMDGTYELEDSVNGMPHWINRDGCHCDNCLGTACHLYWAISTPAAHCNHNCPRWTFDMDLEPNSRTASYPGSASLPPLGAAPWSEYSIRGPGRPGIRSTQLNIVADTAVQICGVANTRLCRSGGSGVCAVRAPHIRRTSWRRGAELVPRSAGKLPVRPLNTRLTYTCRLCQNYRYIWFCVSLGELRTSSLARRTRWPHRNPPPSP
jgi:hypothetical protein